MARKRGEKKEDGLTNLEAKMAELESKIATKSCFGLIIDDNQACLDCPYNTECPEFTDARLVREEESLWVEEVNGELKALGDVLADEEAGSTEASKVESLDWTAAITKVIESKPKALADIASILRVMGVDMETAKRSAPIIVDKLVALGMVVIREADQIDWVKK